MGKPGYLIPHFKKYQWEEPPFPYTGEYRRRKRDPKSRSLLEGVVYSITKFRPPIDTKVLSL